MRKTYYESLESLISKQKKTWPISDEPEEERDALSFGDFKLKSSL